MELANKRVLITGANGFIGGRLAERLAQEEGAQVRGLVRRVGARHFPSQDSANLKIGTNQPTSLGEHIFENASPLQTAIGDITDADAVRHAVDSCDIVVHCAAMQSGRKLADFRRVNVDGTLNLLRAAHTANAARFIHISTINVHGFPPPRAANADSPLNFHGDFYSISKAEGERAAWQFARDNNVPLTVIRPACTYGPRSEAWTMVPLRRVRRGAPVLIGPGDGICNAVYIDNLVDLIMLAMKSDAAVGQAFIGAEGRGVTWREFYGAYARMIETTHLNSLPRVVALAAATVFEAQARITGTSPRVSRSSVEFYSHHVVYDVSKARKLMGYAPRVSFEEGMQRTEEWLMEIGQAEEKRRAREGSRQKAENIVEQTEIENSLDRADE
jgi:nucleoside-diphosphate-sugar epimerase